MDNNEVGNGEIIKNCTSCGMPLEPDTKFCVNCGTPIEGTETAAVPADEPAEEVIADVSLEPQENDTEVNAASAPEAYQPPVEPMYQTESYAPAADMPFPDIPVTEQMGYRQQAAPRKTGVFVSGILGFAVMAVLLAAAFTAGVFHYNFLSQMNFSVVLTQLLIYGSVAFAAALTARAKGPDISVGAVMTLAAFIVIGLSGSWILGIILAVLVCAAIGALNGLLIVYLRVPSLLVTVVAASLIRSIVYMISNRMEVFASSQIIMLRDIRVGTVPVIALGVLAVSFVIAFVLVIASKLGKPISKREAADSKRVSYFLAYLFSSVIACLAGIALMLNLGAAVPSMGVSYEIFIIFIFAAVTSSKFLDNRVLPVLYAIAAAVFFVAAQNVFNLYGLNPFLAQIILAAVTLGMAAVSYAARKDTFKGLVQRV